MAKNTAIEWTDDSDNVIVLDNGSGQFGGWFCEKVSEGCDHCYAESLATGNPWHDLVGWPYVPTVDVPLLLRRDKLAGWARQRRPRRHFVNSMTDTFLRHVPDEWLFEIFDAMVAAPLQTFQILTKRADRMLRFTRRYVQERDLDVLPSNIWIMVSAENQRWYDNRVPLLIQTPAQVRGLSLEPLLGPIDLRLEIVGGLHWVIVGGESGPHARPMHPKWARDLRDQSVESGIPFFFKQWGEWVSKPEIADWDPTEDVWTYRDRWDQAVRNVSEWGTLDVSGDYYPETTTWNGRQLSPEDGYEVLIYRVGKKRAGRLLEGREWNQSPTYEGEEETDG